MTFKNRFNWDGISDNGDGTYTAIDRRSRRRLLKEFHRQGFQVRSSKTDGGYSVSAVGMSHRRSSTGSIARLARSRSIAQRRPIRRGYSPAYRSYGSSPRIRRPSALARAGSWAIHKTKEHMIKKQQEQNRRIEQKKTEAEIEGKLKQERVAAERAETVRELRKQELAREKLRFEKQQLTKRLRDNLGHKTTLHPPTPAPREPKVDSGALVEARNNYVSGSGGE